MMMASSSSAVPKKSPPLPWSHLETVNLIEVYQEKWYSLKRGQLKASQWEEVGVSVAARCGFKELSKSSTQCRHKMEKLRKRYRSEKQRSSPSVWPYFDLMDLMERGPFPISARPLPPISHHLQFHDDDENNNKSRSINRILRRPPIASPVFDALPLPRKLNSGGGERPGVSKFLRNPMFRKRKNSFEVDDVEEEGGGRLLSELASVVRAFSEGFVRLENMKMDMMKETERYRIEMEKKRMDLIHESHSRIVDAIATTFNSHNKSKKIQET